jgi:hypothetical protein
LRKIGFIRVVAQLGRPGETAKALAIRPLNAT